MMCTPDLPGLLVIDGSHEEGGGQILRTAASLAAILGRRLRVERIRAGRRNPGLAAQHLTAIRAAGAICNATLAGDSLGSQSLEFHPRSRALPATYEFDVAKAREGGSAGAATLVLQTVMLPLALQGAKSTVVVRGGTHIPWSPSYDYFECVWLEMMRRLGLRARARLDNWGFFPAGRGEITLRLGNGEATQGRAGLNSLKVLERGRLTSVEGRAVAANLPAHIAQRMANRAEALLRPLGVPRIFSAECAASASPGAWIFMKAVYENAVSGFGAHGRRGKTSEQVAEDAVEEFMAFHDSTGALDRHLADQMLLPLSFADGVSEFSCAAVTRHLQTNAWVIEQFGAARIEIEPRGDGTGHVRVQPAR